MVSRGICFPTDDSPPLLLLFFSRLLSSFSPSFSLHFFPFFPAGSSLVLHVAVLSLFFFQVVKRTHRVDDTTYGTNRGGGGVSIRFKKERARESWCTYIRRRREESQRATVERWVCSVAFVGKSSTPSLSQSPAFLPSVFRSTENERTYLKALEPQLQTSESQSREQFRPGGSQTDMVSSSNRLLSIAIGTIDKMGTVIRTRVSPIDNIEKFSLSYDEVFSLSCYS